MRLDSPRVSAGIGLMAAIALGLPLLCSSALCQSEVATIDHVRILVHDIAAAQNQYRNLLGFDMSRAKPFIYPEGSAHTGTEFTDGIYLELIGIADRAKLVKSRPWIVDFLQDHQGAHSVGMITTSAKDVADRLQSHGIEAPLFKLVSSHPGAKPILLVTPKLVNLPDGAIFFVEYPVQPSARTVVQPNTTQGMAAVWIVVKDLQKASQKSEALGFHPGRLLDFKQLGAQGRELQTGPGKILLLEANSSGKPTASFLRERGQGVMGLTLAVGDIAKARSLIGGKTNRELPTYEGGVPAWNVLPAPSSFRGGSGLCDSRRSML
jgi:catechol 2,3-dioxygenase-like lactoylglutathione lyase family enzyme